MKRTSDEQEGPGEAVSGIDEGVSGRRGGGGWSSSDGATPSAESRSSSMTENIALAGGEAPSGVNKLSNTDEYQYAAMTDLNRMEATEMPRKRSRCTSTS